MNLGLRLKQRLLFIGAGALLAGLPATAGGKGKSPKRGAFTKRLDDLVAQFQESPTTITPITKQTATGLWVGSGFAGVIRHRVIHALLESNPFLEDHGLLTSWSTAQHVPGGIVFQQAIEPPPDLPPKSYSFENMKSLHDAEGNVLAIHPGMERANVSNERDWVFNKSLKTKTHPTAPILTDEQLTDELFRFAIRKFQEHPSQTAGHSVSPTILIRSGKLPGTVFGQNDEDATFKFDVQKNLAGAILKKRPWLADWYHLQTKGPFWAVPTGFGYNHELFDPFGTSVAIIDSLHGEDGKVLAYDSSPVHDVRSLETTKRLRDFTYVTGNEPKLSQASLTAGLTSWMNRLPHLRGHTARVRGGSMPGVVYAPVEVQDLAVKVQANLAAELLLHNSFLSNYWLQSYVKTDGHNGPIKMVHTLQSALFHMPFPDLESVHDRTGKLISIYSKPVPESLKLAQPWAYGKPLKTSKGVIPKEKQEPVAKEAAEAQAQQEAYRLARDATNRATDVTDALKNMIGTSLQLKRIEFTNDGFDMFFLVGKSFEPHQLHFSFDGQRRRIRLDVHRSATALLETIASHTSIEDLEDRALLLFQTFNNQGS